MSEIKHVFRTFTEFKLTFLSSILFICTTILWHLPVESSYSSWARGVQVTCHPFELGSAELPSYHARAGRRRWSSWWCFGTASVFFLASQALHLPPPPPLIEVFLIVIVTWCGALWHRPPFVKHEKQREYFGTQRQGDFSFSKISKAGGNAHSSSFGVINGSSKCYPYFFRWSMGPAWERRMEHDSCSLKSLQSWKKHPLLGFFFSHEAFLAQDSFLIDAYTSGQLESLAVCLTMVGDFWGHTGILFPDHLL